MPSTFTLSALATRLGLHGAVVTISRPRAWTLREQTRAAARGEALPDRTETVYAFRAGWGAADEGDDTILGTSQRAARAALRRMAAQ